MSKNFEEIITPGDFKKLVALVRSHSFRSNESIPEWEERCSILDGFMEETFEKYSNQLNLSDVHDYILDNYLFNF